MTPDPTAPVPSIDRDDEIEGSVHIVWTDKEDRVELTVDSAILIVPDPLRPGSRRLMALADDEDLVRAMALLLRRAYERGVELGDPQAILRRVGPLFFGTSRAPTPSSGGLQ